MSILTNAYFDQINPTTVDLAVTSDYTGGQGTLRAVLTRSATATYADFENLNGQFSPQELIITAPGENYFIFENLLPGVQYYAHFIEDDGSSANTSNILSLSVDTDAGDDDVYLLPEDMQTRQRFEINGPANKRVYLSHSSHGFVDGDFVDIYRVDTSASTLTVRGVSGWSDVFAPKGNVLRTAGEYIRATFNEQAQEWDLDFYSSGIQVTDTFRTVATQDTEDDFTEGTYTGISNLVLANGLRARSNYLSNDGDLRISTVMRPVNINVALPGFPEAWVMDQPNPDTFPQSPYPLVEPIFGSFIHEEWYSTLPWIHLQLRNVAREVNFPGTIISAVNNPTSIVPPTFWQPADQEDTNVPVLQMVASGVLRISGNITMPTGILIVYPGGQVPTIVSIVGSNGSSYPEISVTYDNTNYQPQV